MSEPAEYSREAEIKEGLSHIRALGESKPLGYLPLDTLRDFLESSLAQELDFATEHGYEVIVLWPGETTIGFDGVIYVYDPAAFLPLLIQYKADLEQAGWPTDPEGFIRRIANEHVESGKIRELIDRAFGQK